MPAIISPIATVDVDFAKPEVLECRGVADVGENGRYRALARNWPGHATTPIQENQVGLYEPWPAIGDNWRPGVPAGTFYSDGIKALRRTGETKRDGVMATLQFRPSNAWTSTLDLFHSEAEQVDTAKQFEVHIGYYNGTNAPDKIRLIVTNPNINGNNTFTGGTVGNVYPLVRGMYNRREDEINAFGWNNEFAAGQARIVADIGWSRAKRDELNLENNTQMLPFPQFDTLQLQIRNNGFSQINPGRDYSNPNSLYLTNTIYGSGYGKAPNVVDELRTAKLAAFPRQPSSRISMLASTMRIERRTSGNPKATSTAARRAIRPLLRTSSTARSISGSPVSATSRPGTCLRPSPVTWSSTPWDSAGIHSSSCRRAISD